MNIDDLSFGQIKQLFQLFNPPTKSNLYDQYIGKYVICRSYSEGVNAGKVLAADETGVIIEDARRLHYHLPKNKKVSWYEGVAKNGISEKSRVGEPVKKLIVEDYSLTLCTPEAEKSLREAISHAQS